MDYTLIFRGVVLRNDDKRLTEYGMQNDAKLHLKIATPAASTVKRDAEEPQLVEMRVNTDDNETFFQNLRTFLSRHFSAADASAVTDRVRINLEKRVASLNLDDLERVLSA